MRTLATFAYDDLGRRKTLSRGNNVTTAYAYNPANLLLESVTHTLPQVNGAPRLTTSLSA
ncbi:hypothetical protein ACRAWD_10685 [Caulobacter segnis]